MIGAIRTWDIVSHPVATVQTFGWRIFFRAVFSGQGETFLSLLRQDGAFAAGPSNVPALVERCIGLELQASQVYATLAERFAASLPLHAFLKELAGEEQDHADMLQVCREAARRGGWRDQYFHPWEDYVPLLEQQMAEITAALDRIDEMDDALRLVIQVEFSEINHVFLAVLQATDSPFVRKLRAFRQGVEQHLHTICREVPTFAPSAMLACRELRAKFRI